MNPEWNDVVYGLGDDATLSLTNVEPSVELGDNPLPAINWDTLQIIDPHDEEGRIEIVDDDEMYKLLGLREEDEATEKATNDNAPAAATNDNAPDPLGNDTLGAAIPVDDDIPGERVVVHDPNKPSQSGSGTGDAK